MDHSHSESTPHAAPRGERRLAGLLVSAVLGAYRLAISPMLGPSCRFEPSCSRYAEQAVARHGIWRGGMMALRRLLRCHPWGGAGGFDPVS